jgi:hypothetical protein
MKNFAEVVEFINGAVVVGSQIGKDHGATSIDLRGGMFEDVLPPSLASGVGQVTQALMFSVRVSFMPSKTPVQRSRKFTIFNSVNGKEIWPGANMTVDNTGCFFQLHIGNAMNSGWGIFADSRMKNLGRVISQVENLMQGLTKDDYRAISVLPIGNFSFS